MARETKIGLIVGLAFIICFAVILANRGRPRPRTTHVTYAVDRGVSGTQVFERGDGLRGNAARTGAASRRVTGPANPRMIQPTSSSVPTSISAQAPTTGADAPPADHPREMSGSRGSGDRSPGLRSLPARGQRPMANARPARSKLLEELASKINDRFGDGSATVEHTPSGPDQMLLSDNVAASRNDEIRVESNAATPDPARQRTEAVRHVSLRHTVVAGETLSKIAARYYGSRSGKLVQALYAANRSVMKSPNLLRVGVELRIPRVEGFPTPATGGKNVGTSVPRSVTGNATRRTVRPKSPSQRVERQVSPETGSKRSIRWYQVQKNDRYASIARRLLGNTSRWHEIYELNQDKFPDPNRIREGVRIKIPAAHIAAPGSMRP